MIDYSRDLLFLLNDVGRLLRIEADRRAKVHGMTRAQWGILLWLAREPGLSQRELAEILEVEPITVARLVDRLEARGMVERRADGNDRRIWRLHLTPATTPVLHDIQSNCAAMSAALTQGMPAASQARFVDTLLTMKSILSAERRADTKEVA
ncbi:MarR family winged helix-turn-helix transcriptional regulator [Acidisphaera sp. L21]|uniref:MarR family winged helix-turn-helix transcriptional regulator n=1 Tax=Acidisphaera sp. L21 TaxID=1641851 RepID=UPI0020B124B9|nr:MarR family transcriptional regulator [Acidisphaera sp. L21]